MEPNSQQVQRKKRSPIRIIITVMLFAFVGISAGYMLWAQKGPEGAATEAKGGKPSGTKVLVYYFYTNTRCASCKRIEAWTRDTLQEAFSSELADGSVGWKPVNVEGPGNGHFIKDFALSAKTVVVCRIRDGKTEEWKDLIEVWRFLSDNPRFSRLICDQVREYLQKS